MFDTEMPHHDSDDKTELRLEVYQNPINKIDDYFEYSHESEQDKRYVMACLNKLTKDLKII